MWTERLSLLEKEWKAVDEFLDVVEDVDVVVEDVDVVDVVVEDVDVVDVVDVVVEDVDVVDVVVEDVDVVRAHVLGEARTDYRKNLLFPVSLLTELIVGFCPLAQEDLDRLELLDVPRIPA